MVDLDGGNAKGLTEMIESDMEVGVIEAITVVMSNAKVGQNIKSKTI